MDIIVSKKSILILSFHNCELYCCHLDGYKTNTKALLGRMEEIEEIIMAKSVNARFRLWYNVDETCMDKRTSEMIANSIARMEKHIYKIAFIGLEGMEQRRFNRFLERALESKPITKAFFQDAELAKGWLV